MTQPYDDPEWRRQSAETDAFLKRHFKPENVDAVRKVMQAMWSNSDDTDKQALAAQLVPGVGDLAGVADDARHWVDDRASGHPWTAEDYALSAAGLLPIVPAGHTLKMMGKAAKIGGLGYMEGAYRAGNAIGGPALGAFSVPMATTLPLMTADAILTRESRQRARDARMSPNHRQK